MHLVCQWKIVALLTEKVANYYSLDVQCDLRYYSTGRKSREREKHVVLLQSTHIRHVGTRTRSEVNITSVSSVLVH